MGFKVDTGISFSPAAASLAQQTVQFDEQNKQKGAPLSGNKVAQLENKDGVAWACLDLGPSVKYMIGAPDRKVYVPVPITVDVAPMITPQMLRQQGMIYEIAPSPLHPQDEFYSLQPIAALPE